MTRTMAFITTALTSMVFISATCGQQAEVVQTTLGHVQGLRQTVLGKDYDVYWGIPFAKSPLGDLRFKRPEPAEPWTGTLSADTKPNSCYQVIDTSFDKFPGVDMWNPNTPMSEDCLYLNVWVPRAFGSQLPNTTMVWIYGGGFFSGTSTLDLYDGARLAVTHNMIVASMNYRVGPLGFLYTGTMDAPGNQGLLDQALALKWIYDNIVNFGGQQNSITIFGESAGAASVGFQLMSNVSQDYFTRAIMESAAPTADWGIMSHTQATTRAQGLSNMFDCPLNSIAGMVQCLRQVDAENITMAQWSLLTSGFYLEIPFPPVVDGHFILEEPRVLMAKGAIKNTQLLIGANKDEGMYWLVFGFPGLFPLNNSGSISDTEFKDLVHALTFYADEKVDKAFMYEYVDSIVPSDRDPYRHVADDISGDMLFICPIVAFAESFTSLKGQRDVYLYSYEHHLSNNPWPDWTGVMHGYEIDAVFGLPQEFNYTQQDVDVAARVTGYWSRFAMTGNPNNGSDALWPKLTSQEAGYLKIRGEGDSAGKGMRYRQCSFLSTLLPLIQEEPITETPECPTGGQQTTCPLSSLILLSTLSHLLFCLLLKS